MSISRLLQIAAFLSALALAFAAPLAGSADACTGGESGGDC